MSHDKSHRQFIARRATALALPGGSRRRADARSSSEFLLLEAEVFEDHGGWEPDQQSMEQRGSPYLLATCRLPAIAGN